MSRAIRLLGLAILLVGVAAGGPALAQQGLSVRLSAPSVDRFPEISLYVSVTDASGRRFPGLPPTAFRLVEDQAVVGQPTVTDAVVGTRQVFVINASAALRLRDPFGRSRFDYVKQGLLEWWQLPAAAGYGTDDLTLVTPDGVLAAHSPTAAELAANLAGFESTFEGDVIDYDLLLQGLDFLSDPPSQPGMPSFLVFFTPPIPTGREAALTNAIDRAKETGTVIYPVFTGTAEAALAPEADGLRQLATVTGGTFLVFDPAAGLLDLADLILQQQTQYQLTYSSLANRAGRHTIQVAINLEGGEAVSEPIPFEVDVRPPLVTFLDPPTKITRQLDDPSQTIEELEPSSQTVRLLVTFPDGHPRPIASSRLIVDDIVVLQRAAAPFEELVWDLTPYLETGTHIVRASVEDRLGLESETEDLPVEIEVIGPPRGLAALRPAIGPLAAAVGILVVGILAAVGARSIGRMRAVPRAASASEIQATKRKGAVPRPPRRVVRRAGMRRPEESEPAEAYLMTEGDSEAFALTGVDVVIGRDPSLAAVVLDDPSVAGLHARLIRQADGEYLLRDQGSVSGTWVNYEPVPAAGRRLRHEDLVHIGRVTLRFRLAAPPPAPRIDIRPAAPSAAGADSSQEPPL